MAKTSKALGSAVAARVAVDEAANTDTLTDRREIRVAPATSSRASTAGQPWMPIRRR